MTSLPGQGRDSGGPGQLRCPRAGTQVTRHLNTLRHRMPRTTTHGGCCFPRHLPHWTSACEIIFACQLARVRSRPRSSAATPDLLEAPPCSKHSRTPVSINRDIHAVLGHMTLRGVRMRRTDENVSPNQQTVPLPSELAVEHVSLGASGLHGFLCQLGAAVAIPQLAGYSCHPNKTKVITIQTHPTSPRASLSASSASRESSPSHPSTPGPPRCPGRTAAWLTSAGAPCRTAPQTTGRSRTRKRHAGSRAGPASMWHRRSSRRESCCKSFEGLHIRARGQKRSSPHRIVPLSRLQT